MNLYDLPPSRNIEDRRNRQTTSRGQPWLRQAPQSLLDMMHEREQMQSGFRPIQRARPGMASSLGYNAISPQPQRGMMQPEQAMFGMQRPFWMDYIQSLTRDVPSGAAELGFPMPMYNNPAR